MKKIYHYLLFIITICLTCEAEAQTTRTFALKLVGTFPNTHYDLVSADAGAGTQTTVATLDTSKLSDFNPETSCFDFVNHKILVAGWHGSTDRIFAIDVLTGSIQFYNTSFTPVEMEFGNGKAFAFHNLPSNQIELVRVDIGAGTETVVAILDSTKISDVIPEASSYDYVNNRIVVAGWHGSTDRIFSIDVTNGNIVYQYGVSFQPDDLEYGNGKAYITKYSLGQIQLIRVDIGLGTETTVATLDSSVISDFNPEATSYDPVNNRFIAAGWHLGQDRIFAIDVSTGAIVHHYACGFEAGVAENDTVTTAPPTIVSALVSSPAFSVFPNPGSGKFIIDYQHESGNESEISELTVSEVEVYSILGSKISSKQFSQDSEHQICVDLSNQLPGVYFLKLKTGNGLVIKQVVRE